MQVSLLQRWSLRPLRLSALWIVASVVAGISMLSEFAAGDDSPSRSVEGHPSVPDRALFGLDAGSASSEHWAFQPVIMIVPPLLEHGHEWVKSPIDVFILQGLQKKGLHPSVPTDDRSWVRRVYFDLIGLPPSSEEISEFLDDKSADARERLVDSLLSNPGYGIRWGRRWLDVVRYADTNGYERDANKPNAWRYRDYVIDSLNADKTYFRFLTEQIAGDELGIYSTETLIAPTFLRLGTWDDEPADVQIDRYDQLDDIVRSVSATFLGLTLGCARCHNHKFEPLSQIDYARMLAIFEPLQRPNRGRIDADVPIGSPSELMQYKAAIARGESATKAITEQIKALDDIVLQRFLLDYAASKSKLSPEAFEAHRIPPDQRTVAQKKLVRDSSKDLAKEFKRMATLDEKHQRERFEEALKSIQDGNPQELPRAYLWEETAGTIAATQVLHRGDPSTPAGQVTPGFPEILDACSTEMLVTDEKSATSLRRLSLARWMTSPRNPLVSRVAVNRVWQGHFGEGIVHTENDFGLMGDAPSHRKLLDWLATQFQQRDGQLKCLHRLIVLSNTYAQSSRWREDAAQVDPDNRLLGRYPYRRLEAEVIRDSALAISGQLNLKMGGPGFFPKIAPEVLAGQSRPGLGWGSSDEHEASRRSCYIFIKRSLLVPEMELMDFADPNESCEQRGNSTIPTQALTLLNGEFLNRQSQLLAERLLRDAGNDSINQIDLAYRLVFGGAPTSAETTTAIRFLERQRTHLKHEVETKDKPDADIDKWSLQAFCLVLYNLNEFIYVD